MGLMGLRGLRGLMGRQGEGGTRRMATRRVTTSGIIELLKALVKLSALSALVGK